MLALIARGKAADVLIYNIYIKDSSRNSFIYAAAVGALPVKEGALWLTDHLLGKHCFLVEVVHSLVIHKELGVIHELFTHVEQIQVALVGFCILEFVVQVAINRPVDTREFLEESELL